MKLQEFLDRVIASTSFGAYTQLISGKQPIISQHLVQGLIPVWALGVFVFHGLRGVQNVFGMLAGLGLSQMIPLPAEQADGLIVTPSVLLYFAVIATISAALDCSLTIMHLNSTMESAIRMVFDQYIALFATTRAYSTFQSADQIDSLAILSIVYITLPASITDGVSLDSSSALFGMTVWRNHYIHCIEGLSVRASMIWVGDQLKSWAGGGDSLLLLYFLAVYLSAQRPNQNVKSEKLSECHTMISLLCAQQIMSLLTNLQMSSWLMLCILSTLVILVATIYKNNFERDEHIFADVCTFALSLLVADLLETYLEGSGPAELFGIYTAVFALLEYLKEAAWKGSVIPAQGVGGMALVLLPSLDQDSLGGLELL